MKSAPETTLGDGPTPSCPAHSQALLPGHLPLVTPPGSRGLSKNRDPRLINSSVCRAQLPTGAGREGRSDDVCRQQLTCVRPGAGGFSRPGNGRQGCLTETDEPANWTEWALLPRAQVLPTHAQLLPVCSPWKPLEASPPSSGETKRRPNLLYLAGWGERSSHPAVVSLSLALSQLWLPAGLPTPWEGA